MFVHGNILLPAHQQVLPGLDFNPISDLALAGEDRFSNFIWLTPSFRIFQAKWFPVPGWVTLPTAQSLSAYCP